MSQQIEPERAAYEAFCRSVAGSSPDATWLAWEVTSERTRGHWCGVVKAVRQHDGPNLGEEMRKLRLYWAAVILALLVSAAAPFAVEAVRRAARCCPCPAEILESTR